MVNNPHLNKKLVVTGSKILKIKEEQNLLFQIDQQIIGLKFAFNSLLPSIGEYALTFSVVDASQYDDLFQFHQPCYVLVYVELG